MVLEVAMWFRFRNGLRCRCEALGRLEFASGGRRVAGLFTGSSSSIGSVGLFVLFEEFWSQRKDDTTIESETLLVTNFGFDVLRVSESHFFFFSSFILTMRFLMKSASSSSLKFETFRTRPSVQGCSTLSRIETFWSEASPTLASAAL